MLECLRILPVDDRARSPESSNTFETMAGTGRHPAMSRTHSEVEQAANPAQVPRPTSAPHVSSLQSEIHDRPTSKTGHCTTDPADSTGPLHSGTIGAKSGPDQPPKPETTDSAPFEGSRAPLPFPSVFGAQRVPSTAEKKVKNGARSCTILTGASRRPEHQLERASLLR